jgi:hypothetical protein
MQYRINFKKLLAVSVLTIFLVVGLASSDDDYKNAPGPTYIDNNLKICNMSSEPLIYFAYQKHIIGRRYITYLWERIRRGEKKL